MSKSKQPQEKKQPEVFQVELLRGITDFNGKPHKAGETMTMSAEHYKHFNKSNAVKKV